MDIEKVNETKECHCGSIADKYRKRGFVNQLGNSVTRVFYRCRNCLSRIHEDFIPEMNGTYIDVLDLIKNPPSQANN